MMYPSPYRATVQNDTDALMITLIYGGKGLGKELCR